MTLSSGSKIALGLIALGQSSDAQALLSSGPAGLSGGLSLPGRTLATYLEPRNSELSFTEFTEIIVHKTESSMGGRGVDMCSSFPWYQHSSVLLGSCPFHVSVHGPLMGTSALLGSYFLTSAKVQSECGKGLLKVKASLLRDINLTVSLLPQDKLAHIACVPHFCCWLHFFQELM